MSILEVTSDFPFSSMEEKFSLVKISDGIYEGNYPLQPFRKGARGTYGGEFISQGLLAAWETVEDTEFSPHSFHSYFLKAGSDESVMRWEVSRTSDGRNYSNRLVHCYQTHNNKLCFILVASFTRKNSIKQRHLEYQQDPTKQLPFEFQRTPQYFFDKYYSRLDELPSHSHTNGAMSHILPEEFFVAEDDNSKEIGMRDLGFFFKINDNLNLAKNELKAKITDIVFASDSLYLATIVRAIGQPFGRVGFDFFKVSLDHAVWFHDTDFDPTKWMFMDYRFSRMSNDRVLCQCQVFNEKGNMVVSIVQEALVFLPKRVIEEANGGSYKL